MSWEQLIEIGRENAAERERELQEPEVACPNDGEPYDESRHCKYCGHEPNK